MPYSMSARDHYICKVAKTVQDATELVELGFDYVTEMDGVKLFRKPAKGGMSSLNGGIGEI